LDAKGTSPIRFDVMVGMRSAAVHCQGVLRISHTRFSQGAGLGRFGEASSSEPLGCFLECFGLAAFGWLRAGGRICTGQNLTRRGRGGNRLMAEAAGAAVMARAAEPPSWQGRRSRRHGKGGGAAVMARGAEPPSWQGSGASPGSDCHPSPVGDRGGSGRGYPWQTGMTSGGGPQRQLRREQVRRRH
jgi:hypothetical protein